MNLFSRRSYFLSASLNYLMNLFSRRSYFLLASLNYLMHLLSRRSYFLSASAVEIHCLTVTAPVRCVGQQAVNYGLAHGGRPPVTVNIAGRLLLLLLLFRIGTVASKVTVFAFSSPPPSPGVLQVAGLVKTRFLHD